jgi:hypothetical protein
MKKIALQSLEDYMAEPSAINLKLFVLSVAPNAKWRPNELKSLIDKYSKDKSKLRLASIESYLNSGVSVKSSKSVKSVKEPINYLPKGVDDTKLGELNELKRKYVSNLNRTGSKAALEENEALRQSIDDMEHEMGLRFDYKDIPASSAEDSEKSLLLGILGDWTNPTSISWELLHGTKTYFEIIDSGKQNTSAFGMAGLIRSLEKFSGAKVRPFNIQFVFPQGDAGAKAKWTFSLNAQMSSVAMMTQTLNNYSNELQKLT